MAEADEIGVVPHQFRVLVRVLDVVYLRSLGQSAVPSALLALVLVPPEYVQPLGFPPAPAIVHKISSPVIILIPVIVFVTVRFLSSPETARGSQRRPCLARDLPGDKRSLAPSLRRLPFYNTIFYFYFLIRIVGNSQLPNETVILRIK